MSNNITNIVNTKPLYRQCFRHIMKRINDISPLDETSFIIYDTENHAILSLFDVVNEFGNMKNLSKKQVYHLYNKFYSLLQYNSILRTIKLDYLDNYHIAMIPERCFCRNIFRSVTEGFNIKKKYYCINNNHVISNYSIKDEDLTLSEEMELLSHTKFCSRTIFDYIPDLLKIYSINSIKKWILNKFNIGNFVTINLYFGPKLVHSVASLFKGDENDLFTYNPKNESFVFEIDNDLSFEMHIDLTPLHVEGLNRAIDSIEVLLNDRANCITYHMFKKSMDVFYVNDISLIDCTYKLYKFLNDKIGFNYE